MSSARRLQEDYRRIIGLQDETRGLDDDLPRMRIGGQRGVFQIGSGETKSGSAGGEDEDGNVVDPVTPDEGEDNQNDDGSGGGGGGTDPSNPLEPEIIDPEDPPESGADVNDSTFGGGWATGGPKSFVDCETGQCIELIETGGYISPEGWDDADNGFDLENYDPSFVWRSDQQDSPKTNYPTPQAALNYTAWTTVIITWGFGFAEVPVIRFDSVSFFSESNASASLLVRTPTGNERLECCYGSARRFSISALGIDAVPPDPLSHWPADDCIQLAPNSEGNWAASDKENPADMTAKYSEPKSQLTLCTPSGDTVEIYNRVGGGYVYFNSDQGIWAGSDSSGRMRSFGSTSTLNQEIARPRN